jgi:hypothetical protein
LRIRRPPICALLAAALVPDGQLSGYEQNVRPVVPT